MDVVSSEDKEYVELPGRAHQRFSPGRQAHQTLWPKIDEWISAQGRTRKRSGTKGTLLSAPLPSGQGSIRTKVQDEEFEMTTQDRRRQAPFEYWREVFQKSTEAWAQAAAATVGQPVFLAPVLRCGLRDGTPCPDLARCRGLAAIPASASLRGPCSAVHHVQRSAADLAAVLQRMV